MRSARCLVFIFFFLAVSFPAFAQPNATTTSVSCTPNPVAINETVTCTASVLDIGGSPITPITGTVTFSNSGAEGFSGNPCTLSGAGNPATCQVTLTPASPAGTRNITASYGGDGSHTSSDNTTSPFSLTATLRTTTTSVSCSPASVPINDTSTCTITVTDTDSGTALNPSGTVTLSSSQAGDGGNGGTCTLSGASNPGTCTVNVTPQSPAGARNITASFPASSNHAGSDNTTSPFSLTATLRTTTTSVSCSPASVPINATSTCTITVTDTDSGTALNPSGTVTLSSSQAGDGGNGGTCTLSGASNPGTCTVNVTPQSPAGARNITASFPASSNHAGSDNTTSPFSLTATLRTTTTDVSCSPASVFINEGSTCTITVTDTDTGTALTPSGTVTLSSTQTGDTGHGGTCSLNGAGATASCNVTLTPQSPAGARTVSASFPASSNHAASNDDAAPFSLTANLRTTSTSVSCTGPVVPTQGSTCTATVTDTASGTSSVPSGTITFTNTGSQGSGSFSGTCSLDGSGQCSVTYTPSTANNAGGGASGTHNIQASYGGSSVHATSSGSTSITVNARDVKTEISCAVDFAPNFVRAGNGKSCTATVTDIEAAGTSSTPSGSVTQATTGSGTFVPNPCTLSSGSCASTHTPTGNGVVTISGAYGGSTVHQTSNSNDADGTNFTMQVDGTNPTGTGTVTGSPTHGAACASSGGGSGCYVTSATTLQVAVSDPTVNTVSSGIASCTLTVSGPGGSFNPSCASGNNTFTIASSFADGTYSVRLSASDNVGNSISNVLVLTVTLDNTAPVISFPLGSPKHLNRWLTSNTSISISITDGSGSGVQTGTCVSTVTPTSTVGATTKTNGVHTGSEDCSGFSTTAGSGASASTSFTFGVPRPAPNIVSSTFDQDFTVAVTTVADNLGNSSTNSMLLTLDNTPPVLEQPVAPATRTQPNGFGWNNTDVTLTWICNDIKDTRNAAVSPSGLGAITATGATSGTSGASPLIVAVTSEGENQQVTGTCSDNVTNSDTITDSRKVVQQINIDKTAPIVLYSDQSLFAEDSEGTLFNYPALEAFDNLSGVASEVVCDPPSGTLFRVGVNLLSCTVSDFADNVRNQTFLIRVIPALPPGVAEGERGKVTPISDSGGPDEGKLLFTFEAFATNGLPIVFLQTEAFLWRINEAGTARESATLVDANPVGRYAYNRSEERYELVFDPDDLAPGVYELRSIFPWNETLWIRFEVK